MPDDCNVIELLSLTRSDLATLDDLAQTMIAAGMWNSAVRARDHQCDRLEVTLDNVCGPAFSLGVLASHRYFYMDHRSSAVMLGQDLDDILEQTGLGAGNG